MVRLILGIIVLAFVAPITARAETIDADFITVDADTDLAQFVWTKRPIVVFANSPLDPRFREQIDLLRANLDALTERDVVVLLDTDPTIATPTRRELHPRDFALVIIGKDGRVALRKPLPWDVREISRVIDKMPLRQGEMKASKQ